MERIRYHAPAAGAAKAIVHLTPERAFVFECWEREPAADGCFRLYASDPSRGVWMQVVKVSARHRMGALGRVAEAAIQAWDELGGVPWPREEAAGPDPIEPVLLTGH